MHKCKITDCKHLDTEFCNHCRKVYCNVCGKEWGEKEIQFVPYVTYTNPNYVYPNYPVYPNVSIPSVWTGGTSYISPDTKWTYTDSNNLVNTDDKIYWSNIGLSNGLHK